MIVIYSRLVQLLIKLIIPMKKISYLAQISNLKLLMALQAQNLNHLIIELPELIKEFLIGLIQESMDLLVWVQRVTH